MHNNLNLLGLDINNLLTEYISLHNALKQKTNSLLSVFRKINFEELEQKAKDILVRLEDKFSEIEELQKRIPDDKFLNCLSEYTQALINTLELYKKILTDLIQKSRGEKLSFKEHMANNKNYEDSINRYTEIGQRLNDLYKNNF